MIQEELNYSIGERATNQELKVALQNLYDKYNIKERAKATHIARYYKVKKCKIRIGDKRVDGYEIIESNSQLSR